ncbi:hypothetical protein T484DRAFT_1929448, partial [Baffinella frigidus]
RQHRTCYALCHLLYPVSAAHTSIFRMDSNSTSYCPLEEFLSDLFPPSVQITRRSESKHAFFAVLSTEGRVVGLCWEKLKPKGPKGWGVGYSG